MYQELTITKADTLHRCAVGSADKSRRYQSDGFWDTESRYEGAQNTQGSLRGANSSLEQKVRGNAARENVHSEMCLCSTCK